MSSQMSHRPPVKITKTKSKISPNMLRCFIVLFILLKILSNGFAPVPMLATNGCPVKNISSIKKIISLLNISFEVGTIMTITLYF